MRMTDRCPSGYYCTHGAITVCAAGFYCPGDTLNQAPRPCEIGYY